LMLDNSSLSIEASVEQVLSWWQGKTQINTKMNIQNYKKIKKHQRDEEKKEKRERKEMEKIIKDPLSHTDPLMFQILI